MFELRPYQAECLETIEKTLVNGTSKQLVALPTGTGKTIKLALGQKRYVQTGYRKDGKGYYVFYHNGSKNKFLTPTATSLNWAIATAEKFVEKKIGGNTILIDKNAEWKQRPPSSKQVDFATKIGIDFDTAIRATKGKLSELIDRRLYQNKKAA